MQDALLFLSLMKTFNSKGFPQYSIRSSGPGIVALAFNSSTWEVEAEAGRALWVQDQLGLIETDPVSKHPSPKLNKFKKFMEILLKNTEINHVIQESQIVVGQGF